MKKDTSKTHIQISKQKGKIKVSGSINLGYIGNFKNSQIEINDTRDIKEQLASIRLYDRKHDRPGKVENSD